MKTQSIRRFPSEATNNWWRRGFTLLELMVVVVIIGVFAALAVPSVVNQLRERRTSNAAQQIAATYRMARMRAMGRGAAVLVRYTPGTHSLSSNKVGDLAVLEAIVGVANAPGPGGCYLTPAVSCTFPSGRWGDGNNNVLYRRIDGSTFSNNGAFEFLEMTITKTNLGADKGIDICFTPAGATMWAETKTTTFSALTDVPSIAIKSVVGGAQRGPTRIVNILPNGVARVAI